MALENLNDLSAFLAVARERSFTKAAAKLGVSQSALSQTVRQLEERIGLRLLTRTTRSVSPTEAGERLLQNVGPHLDEVAVQIEGLSELRERPAGTIKITAGDHAITTLLWPKLRGVLAQYPDINVEISADAGLTDISAHGFNAGVRLGDQVAKDMISARIGPDIRFVVVGTPAYFAKHTPPVIPQDLVDHVCVNLRLATFGGLYAWEFEKDGQELKVRVEGQLVFNNIFHVLDSVLEGFGLAHVPEDIARPHLAKGRLCQVLDDWCPPWPGYHIYYPSRRQASPAFAVVLEALRVRT
jgi:DNA-binding transcriptional LysR family regulator